MPKKFSNKKTALLVDLSFFTMTCQKKFRKHEPDFVAKKFGKYIENRIKKDNDALVCCYVYDCEPYQKDIILPISKTVDPKSANVVKFRQKLLDEVKKLSNIDLKLGKLTTKQQYIINNDLVDKISQSQQCEVNCNLIFTDNDLKLNMTQKGVDILIALDIASLSLKKEIEKIVLISGDTDFIPALQFAKNEGLIVQVDTLGEVASKDFIDSKIFLTSIIPLGSHKN